LKIEKQYIMDTILIILGFICMLTGILGSFLPVLPGPIVSWVGILLLYWTNAIPINYWILVPTFIFMVLISVLDYFIPAKGTKKFGGSKYGIWGTNIGLIVGIFAPIPCGFIIGPFVGAFVGELYFDSQDKNRAFRAATGSLIGLLVSSFMKFVVCMAYLGIFLWIFWEYKSNIF
jgi:uncharacterized protein